MDPLESIQVVVPPSHTPQIPLHVPFPAPEGNINSPEKGDDGDNDDYNLYGIHGF